MKLYTTAKLPNPRRVAIFLAEKGIELPTVQVDLFRGEHLQPAFRQRNPRSRVPVLELDDGSHIAESVAICRYLETLYPTPSLFGATAREAGEIEMQSRILEFDLYMPLSTAWRNGPVMKKYNPALDQIPAALEQAEKAVCDFYRYLDGQLASRDYIAGSFSMADIIALTSIDFATALVDLRPAESLAHLWRWHHQVSIRPGVVAADLAARQPEPAGAL